jgi:hypothetical protein
MSGVWARAAAVERSAMVMVGTRKLMGEVLEEEKLTARSTACRTRAPWREGYHEPGRERPAAMRIR